MLFGPRSRAALSSAAIGLDPWLSTRSGAHCRPQCMRAGPPGSVLTMPDRFVGYLGHRGGRICPFLRLGDHRPLAARPCWISAARDDHAAVEQFPAGLPWMLLTVVP